MLSSRWLPSIVTAALVFSSGGALAHSGTLVHSGRPAGAGGRQVARMPAAGPAHLTGPARGANSARGAELLRLAAIGPAPLVPDSVPAGQSKRGLAAPPLSPAMARANAIRQAQALTYLRTALPPVARELAATQQPQVRNYFCGPATVSEMLAQMHVTLRQLAAARELGTTPAGTDWSDSAGYPVPKVLNANTKLNKFVAVPLPWTPTAAQIKTYQIDLVADINRGAGVPMAGNAYEVPGGPHLVGHPLGQTIMHWFDIRGYSASGAVTDYEDSVHGAPSIGWSAAVPAYSSLTSSAIVDILGARGYVW